MASDTLALYSIEAVIGGAFGDALNGDGADHLIGGDGNDALYAGPGFHADWVEGRNGNDTLKGGDGNDTLDGGAGIDTATYVNAPDLVLADLDAGSAEGGRGGVGVDTLIGIENLVGSAFDDQLTGDAGNNLLDGKGGVNTLTGRAGNDTYVIDTYADVVTEAPGGGVDTLRSFADAISAL